MVGRTNTDEKTISHTDYVFVEEAAHDVSEEAPKLEPLPQFSVGVPAGWKYAIYGKDGTGSASADNDWPESMASGKARE